MQRSHRRIALEEKLERRLLRGLSCEWDNTLAILETAQKQKIKKPLFRLVNRQKQLGAWSADKNVISFSRSLVMNSPWDAVREVLRHEMAHQYAEQEWGAYDEPAHGPKFRKACTLLRADPAATCKIDAFYRRAARLLNPNDKILTRVKKLMALAESCHRHEAEAAMAKAHELIARYNIDLHTQDKARQFISVFAGQPALRHTRDAYHLANLLQTFYFVQGLWVSTYVLAKGKMGRVLEISGTPPNVDIALYVHDYVYKFINAQWSRYNAERNLSLHRRTDFAVGIIEGFYAKLQTEHQRRSKHDESFALVEVGDPRLDRYIAQRYPYTRCFKRTHGSQDGRVLADGMRIGRSLIIAKGITEKRVSRKLITG